MRTLIAAIAVVMIVSTTVNAQTCMPGEHVRQLESRRPVPTQLPTSPPAVAPDVPVAPAPLPILPVPQK